MPAKKTEITLPTYATWRPTANDTAGMLLPDRQNWHVCPVTITRDTEDPCTLSNWESFKKALEATDPEGHDHEIHRFGHWGPGWFEIILVRPDTATLTNAQECADALEYYPILDSADFSEREHTHGCEVWAVMSVRERVEVLRKLHYKGSVLVARRDFPPHDRHAQNLCESIETYLASHN